MADSQSRNMSENWLTNRIVVRQVGVESYVVTHLHGKDATLKIYSHNCSSLSTTSFWLIVFVSYFTVIVTKPRLPDVVSARSLADYSSAILSGHFRSYHLLDRKNKRFVRAYKINYRRSQWSYGQRRRSAVARLPRSWVRIPTGGMDVCCVLSGRGLCDELITRPEEFYRLWCVVVCDLETSLMMRPWPALGPQRHRKKKRIIIFWMVWHSNVEINVGSACRRKSLEPT